MRKKNDEKKCIHFVISNAYTLKFPNKKRSQTPTSKGYLIDECPCEKNQYVLLFRMLIATLKFPNKKLISIEQKFHQKVNHIKHYSESTS